MHLESMLALSIILSSALTTSQILYYSFSSNLKEKEAETGRETER